MVSYNPELSGRSNPDLGGHSKQLEPEVGGILEQEQDGVLTPPSQHGKETGSDSV